MQQLPFRNLFNRSLILFNNSYLFFIVLLYTQGAPLGKWLRHYAVSRKVAGSIPDEINAFFNGTNLTL
jgi:hypothetical protein